MKEYIYLGSAPAHEDCAQTTDPDYGIKAHDECNRYRALLLGIFRAAHGRDPACTLRVKGENHDFGTYYEVVAAVDTDSEAQWDDALWLESNAPEKWQ